jgi:propanol-preferring alcohol dehydrogenase
MKACLLDAPAPAETHPLRFCDVPAPRPGPGEVLVRVRACGVCRTDLHVVEGELAPRRSPLIPGHQAVGVVVENGPGAGRFPLGRRVGIPWLRRTDGVCEFCHGARENLCEAAEFNGWTADGGYAEYVAAPEDFVYALPEGFGDLDAAPLLCAGIIGYRTLRLSNAQTGGSVGIYGFGAAAHVALQVAHSRGIAVYAFSRAPAHRALALALGAQWAGGPFDAPPIALDAAMIFAPAGEQVPAALKALKRGGTVAIGGIHMSPIPPLDYAALSGERVDRRRHSGPHHGS